MLVYGDFLLDCITRLCTSVFGIYLFSPLVLMCVLGLVLNRLSKL